MSHTFVSSYNVLNIHHLQKHLK